MLAFKLIMALEGEYCDTTTLLDNYSDLLSIGTIGDVVELKDENRVFVKHGLESITNTDPSRTAGTYQKFRSYGKNRIFNKCVIYNCSENKCSRTTRFVRKIGVASSYGRL